MSRGPVGAIREGLRFSTLVLGTATFGVAPREHDVDALVARAIDLGVTTIDTASSYGNQSRFDRPGVPPADLRRSAEELVGRALRGRRDEVVLCTKVGERLWDGPDGAGLGRTHVRRAVEQSLRRLQTDHVDLLYAHHPDPAVPVEDLLQTFGELVERGLAREYGISTYSGTQTAELVRRADALGLPRPAAHQVRYSARERGVEDDSLRVSRQMGVPVLTFSPLAGGLLTKGASRRALIGAARWQRPGPGSEERAASARFEELADELALDPAVLALAWVGSQQGVAGAVVGPESVTELEELAPAMSLRLGEDALRAVACAVGP